MSAAEVFGMKSDWVVYEAELHVATLVGGIPKDPDTIRGWLKAKLELGDTELQAIVEETLAEMGWAQLTPENLDELVDQVITKQAKGNSFKMVDGQLVYEGRCMKAAIKEAANALYPGTADKNPWPGCPKGVRKGLANWLIERVEVVERYIPLGRTRPDIEGEQRIKHVSGPQGKRSTINVVDICTDLKLSFHIEVLDDCIPPELWFQLFEYVEKGGLSADRARGDGRCHLTKWNRQ